MFIVQSAIWLLTLQFFQFFSMFEIFHNTMLKRGKKTEIKTLECSVKHFIWKMKILANLLKLTNQVIGGRGWSTGTLGLEGVVPCTWAPLDSVPAAHPMNIPRSSEYPCVLDRARTMTAISQVPKGSESDLPKKALQNKLTGAQTKIPGSMFFPSGAGSVWKLQWGPGCHPHSSPGHKLTFCVTSVKSLSLSEPYFTTSGSPLNSYHQDPGAHQC